MLGDVVDVDALGDLGDRGARLGALAVAAVALWMRLPFIVVVILGAAAAALLLHLHPLPLVPASLQRFCSAPGGIFCGHSFTFRSLYP